MKLSKGRINRAGNLLRTFWVGERLADPAVEEALEVVAAYRQTHAYPLTLVTAGLRQFVESEAETAVVGQRLKRMDRIIQKLVRFPTMKLARMQDVGGCRAVLGDVGEVDAVAGRIRRNWSVVREHDYRGKGEEATVVIAATEAGEAPTEELAARYRGLRRRVAPYLGRPS